MSYLGKIERTFRERTNSRLAPLRRKKLRRTDFSIISNNCWAGSVYRYYGLPYQSPTIGLYFFADDYVKFVYNLRYYLSRPPEFITASESSHISSLRIKGEEHKILARLDDIEVVFLHYATMQEAKEKWERRCHRINWNNLFIKFSEMNECTISEIKKFDSLQFPNKICLTATRMPDIQSSIYFPYSELNGGQIVDDTERFNRGFDVTRWLNSCPAKYEL